MADSVFKRLRIWTADKLNPAQSSIATHVGASSSDGDYYTYAEAYAKIEIINRAVEMIINGCVEIPLIVEGGPGGPTKKVNKLLNLNPNPFEDRARLFRKAFLDFMLEGNIFFYYDNKTSSLYHLPAAYVTVIPDAKTFVSHYEYRVQEMSRGSFYSPRKDDKDSVITFSTDEIIHVMTDNESSMYRGASKIKSCISLIELYNSMLKFQKQFFKNNAVPGFVLKTDNILSTRVKERLLEEWRKSYTTFYGSSRTPAILDGGLSVDPFSSINFDQLDFESSISLLFFVS